MQQQPIHPNSSSLLQLRLLTYTTAPLVVPLLLSNSQNPKFTNFSTIVKTQVSSEKRSEKCMTPEISFSASAAVASSSSSSSDCVFCVSIQSSQPTKFLHHYQKIYKMGTRRTKTWVETQIDCA
jgi:hypothetical protein